MKKVVSVSIGSSKRDHYVETEIMGEKFTIERIGTDGSIKKAIELIERIDGKVDAIECMVSVCTYGQGIGHIR